MPRLWGRAWSREEILERVGREDQIATIRASAASEGLARGARFLDVETGGGLSFRILPDRGADIGACRYQGRPIAWIAPPGEVHPSFADPRGNGWLRTFGGGLMTTCGLDQFGPPGWDGEEELGLHGRAGNTPAERVAWSAAWNGDEYELEVTATVRQARVFGEHMVLRRVIRTAMGSSRIDIADEVTNLGFEPQPHMLLYHCNVGFPLLDEGSTLHVDSFSDPVPRDDVAADGQSSWSRMGRPEEGFSEQVFRHALRADGSGLSVATLSNSRDGLTLRLTVDTATLPYLYQWKMMARGTYVLGLEPANCPGIGGRSAAREEGVLPMLAPQETRRYALSFEVVADQR